MAPAARTLTVLAALAALVGSGDAFLTPTRTQPLALHPSLRGDRPAVAPSPSRDVSAGLFRDLLKKIRRDGGDGDSDGGSEGGDDNDKTAGVSSGREEGEAGEAKPFFASQYLNALEGQDDAAATKGTPAESTGEDAPPSAETKASEVVKEEELSPVRKAEALRAQAARIRLEADKRQVELTLEKIAKLNGKLEHIKGQETVDAKEQASLEEDLQRLKSQLVTDENGETKVAPVPVAAKVESTASASSASQSEKAEAAVSTRPAMSAETMAEQVKLFQEAPEFMKVLVAKTAGFGVDDGTPGAVERLNATDIVQKLYNDEMDYNNIAREPDFATASDKESARAMIERAYKNSADGDGEKPVFPQEQIDAKIKELDDIPGFVKGMLTGMNDTEIALMLLEDEFKEEKRKKEGGGFFGLFGGGDKKEDGDVGPDGESLGRDSGTFSRLFSEGNETSKQTSDLSFMMESLYPKSTRKEDEAPDKRLVDAFLNDVVASTRAFTSSSNPISVPGGWIIRGKNECETGDELIEKLDRRIASDARLREKISFFVLKDPFPDQENQGMDLNPLDWPQVLFVAGPDVAREPAIILRTVISAAGIATAWYGSIYPFLANSKLLDRANEAMELADAGMPTDLSWLSEMSIPLFISFIGLQVIHELAHGAVARAKGFEIQIPTLVPSIMSGITNSITSLKTSPKNKQDLVDFAVAGPLAGMIGSILLLCYGLVLTATADAATVQSFPGLPLIILRQSSLGGGLIDLFLGNGVLNVPASAEGAQALASTLIALHPFAVAGFFSLFVNALSLVPAGRTDGGRISMALFGRSGSQAVTFVSLASLFLLGFSDDLLFFFFAYLVFFQSELEIPMRNEVDDVGLPRVALASFAAFLMLLTLIPM